MKTSFAPATFDTPVARRPPASPRKALLCGLSTRGINLFLEPTLQPSGETGFHLARHLEIVGVIEPDRQRVAAFNAKYGTELKTFSPDDWEKALAELSPDLLLVAPPDHLHVEYLVRGLEAGLDVISEKPMVISSKEARRVLSAEAASSGRVSVAFNYRYHPLHARLKEFLAQGYLGRIVQVDFNYCLDTLHGTSYFYRWNRQRRFSGSLASHKCCHYFDLIRWLIGQDYEAITALGGLDYYGAQSSHRPGGAFGNTECPYMSKWFADGETPHDGDHPIYHLQGDLGLPFPFQYPKPLSIYDKEIDIEDNYSALIQFRKGARMTLSVNFSCPWEGYQLAINGEKGRLEVRYFSAPKRCPFPAVSSATFLPLFGEPMPIEWENAEGGHGGADSWLLRDLFDPAGKGNLPTARDGLMAVAAGEALWRSVVEKRTIPIAELTQDLKS